MLLGFPGCNEDGVGSISMAAKSPLPQGLCSVLAACGILAWRAVQRYGLNIVRVLFLEMLVERGSPGLGHLSSHRTLGMLHTSRHTEEHVGISFFSVKFCAKEECVLDF